MEGEGGQRKGGRERASARESTCSCGVWGGEGRVKENEIGGENRREGREKDTKRKKKRCLRAREKACEREG